MSKPKIGIIAGEGSLPRTLSKNALAQGFETYAAAVNLKAFLDLQGIHTEGKLIPGSQAAKILSFFKENGVTDLICIGKIHKLWAIAQIPLLDSVARSYLARMLNLEDNSFHQIVMQIIEEAGFKLVPQARFLQELMAKKGQLTQRNLTEQEKADLEYGFDMAKRASALEVSQMVVVKNRSVMAFEAAEGTDETIKRGCRLARKNGVVVKVAWKNQSDKFDLPTIGPRTVKTLAKHKGSVLAVEADTTFIAEPEKTIELANKLGIALLGI